MRNEHYCDLNRLIGWASVTLTLYQPHSFHSYDLSLSGRCIFDQDHISDDLDNKLN